MNEKKIVKIQYPQKVIDSDKKKLVGLLSKISDLSEDDLVTIRVDILRVLLITNLNTLRMAEKGLYLDMTAEDASETLIGVKEIVRSEDVKEDEHR